MSSEKDKLEEHIKQFYDNVPDVGDTLPMKDYLLKHENNQMAWYLLGKQYAERGEEGKANYCFAQAGPVYEAFESKASPLLASAREPGQPPKRRSRRKAWAWAAAGVGLLAVALALLLPGGLAWAPGSAPGAEEPAPEAAQTAAPDDAAPPAPAAAPAKGQPAKTPGRQASKLASVAGAADPEADGPAVLGRMLSKPAVPGSSLLVQTPVLDKKWTDWVKSGKPLAEVAASPGQATASVGWLDPQWCDCRPGKDSASPRKAIEAWKPLQEGKLALRSAMINYHARTGKWPASKDQLAGAYPANTMAGWNEEMTAWLGELRKELAKVDGKAAAAPAWPDASGPAEGFGTPAGKLEPLAEQPLEIVVDKKHHRLAVLSGNVLLRNYEVGLGGDLTPEGTFAITEKVRDPNGSSTGTFGSRGMTLSDTLYAIHGTDEPDSIGKDESHGCIRMNKKDVEELYDLVSIGTKVTIAKEGLPTELRAPAERFRLTPAQNETNPHKKYNWLN